MGERIVPLGIACAVALLSALVVVLPRRPVHCALALLVHSLSLAALYLVLDSEFVAMGQVIVYSGAIVVLFLFVVLLLPKGGRVARIGPRRYLTAAVGGGAVLLALGAAVVAALPETPLAPVQTPAQVGQALFGPLLVAFELTAPLLLVALVGAVTIWRRHEREER